MDQLTAYRILRLEPGSSRKEIKEAYALLSKEFHPEENPEEFQKIHEAYVTLTRGGRRIDVSEAETTSAEYQIRHEEEQEAFDFSTVQNVQEEKVEEQEETSYDFDASIQFAEAKEEERLHEVALQAIAEMKMLLTPSYRNKIKYFRAFFKKEEYQEVLKRPEILRNFAVLLEDSELKKTIYDCFIDFYRLRSVNVQQLIPEAAALYEVLDRKRGIHKKNKEKLASGTILFIVLTSAMRSLRISMQDATEDSSVFGVAVFCLLLVVISWFLYKKIYENHSAIFTQFVIALLFLIVNFLAVGFEWYTPLFSDAESGVMVASILVVLSLVWMIGLVVAAIVLKIVRRRKNNI